MIEVERRYGQDARRFAHARGKRLVQPDASETCQLRARVAGLLTFLMTKLTRHARASKVPSALQTLPVSDMRFFLAAGLPKANQGKG